MLIQNSFLQDIQYLLESQQYSSLLLENRIQFLKDKNQTIDTSHDPLVIHQDPSDIIDHFADVGDPSKNKQHTQWILGQYKKKNIRQEDMYRVRPALEHFDKYKSKLDKKDINQYKTLQELETAVRPHIGTAATKKEEAKENIAKGRTLIHEGEDGTKVYRLEPTEEGKRASISTYGGGGDLGGAHTSWCTAADSEYNMFHHYSKRQPLHVIHTKDGEVYQAHPQTEQLMNRHDEEVSGDYEDKEGNLKPHKHAQEISKALDHIPGGGRLKVVKDLPNVTSNDIDSLISSPPGEENYDDIRKAVQHPNITEEQLEKVYNNNTGSVRGIALKHPKLPYHIIKNTLENSNAPFIDKLHAADNPRIKEDDIRKYYNVSTNNDIKNILLGNDSAPYDLLKSVIDHGSHGEIRRILHHPKADADLIRYGVNKHPKQVYNALQNDNVPPDIIDKALDGSGFENQYGQEEAASHKNASTENLQKALKNNLSAVRAAAIQNPNSNESHLKVALNDNDYYVVGKALKHPLITSEHLHDVIVNHNGDVHPMIKDLVFSHEKLSQDDLIKATSSNDVSTVISALHNKNLSNDKLKELTNHQNAEVRLYAEKKLNKR